MKKVKFKIGDRIKIKEKALNEDEYELSGKTGTIKFKDVEHYDFGIILDEDKFNTIEWIEDIIDEYGLNLGTANKKRFWICDEWEIEHYKDIVINNLED